MNNLTKYTNYLKNKNLAPTTIRLYQTIIKQYQQTTLTTKKVQGIFREKLKKCEVSYLILKERILKNYANFLKLKINWEKITRIIPKLQRKFFTTINKEELELLKQARFEESNCLWVRNNLILDFLFYTGLRIGELVNIRHCDYQNQLLKTLGKGNKVRYIFLPEFLTNQINPRSQDCLFPTNKKKPIFSEWVTQIIKRRTEIAGIQKRITPHTFRRSFATNLYNRGVQLITIQRLLGHSKLETTASYIHNDYETLYQDYSKLWKNEPFQGNNLESHGLPK